MFLVAGICAGVLFAVAGSGQARLLTGAAMIASFVALAVRGFLKLRASQDPVLRHTPEMSTLAFPPSSLGK